MALSAKELLAGTLLEAGLPVERAEEELLEQVPRLVQVLVEVEVEVERLVAVVVSVVLSLAPVLFAPQQALLLFQIRRDR